VDPSRYRRFLSHFEFSPTATRLCLISTFLKIGYSECEALGAFAEGRLSFRYFPTQPSVFGYAAEVSEGGFHELLKAGPLFASFDLRACESCNERTEIVRQVAIRISEFGSTTNWCVWDVARGRPRFEAELQLPVPSVWFFPTQNIKDGVFYTGKADILSLIRWAHAQRKDFDLAGVLQRESELAQY
jgi:hypothetical protein